LPLESRVDLLRSEIRTPALLLDMDAMEFNLKKMAAFFQPPSPDVRSA